MRVVCGECGWEHAFDGDDPDAVAAARDGFSDHEQAAHPSGAFVEWVRDGAGS